MKYRLDYRRTTVTGALLADTVVPLIERRMHLAKYLLAPKVNYSGRTAPLTSKVAFYIFIQQI